MCFPHRYEARTPKELPVLTRWMPTEAVPAVRAFRCPSSRPLHMYPSSPSLLSSMQIRNAARRKWCVHRSAPFGEMATGAVQLKILTRTPACVLESVGGDDRLVSTLLKHGALQIEATWLDIIMCVHMSRFFILSLTVLTPESSALAYLVEPKKRGCSCWVRKRRQQATILGDQSRLRLGTGAI